MAKKKLKSGFELPGIAPNLLLKDIENTAPFIFQGEIDTSLPKRDYLEKIRFYKKNLKLLKNFNLYDYFYFCLSAHWSTAGTYVPTDVDNQIRQGLWLHSSVKKHLENMLKLTIESWKWDYSEVTHRKCYLQELGTMSTHEGTWLSVAIGAYCAAKKYGMDSTPIEEVILAEIKKEEQILLKLKEKQKAIDLIKCAPLVAHNFGDLDRVMVAWDMHESDSFCKSIYKLGHKLNPSYSPILVFNGKVNKEFTAKENHRHLSLRKTKVLRKSKDFLIHVGPFMDDWGKIIGTSSKLSMEEKAEIVCALWDGIKRQEEAFGYIRALAQIIKTQEEGLKSFEAYLAIDLFQELKGSSLSKVIEISQEEFEQSYIKRLIEFQHIDLNFNYSS